jgi:hypothetical protein
MAAQITLDAINEGTVGHPVTFITVSGSQFPKCSQTDVRVHLLVATGKTLAHGVTAVGSDGSFVWHTLLFPKQPLGTQLTAVAYDAVVTATDTKDVH